MALRRALTFAATALALGAVAARVAPAQSTPSQPTSPSPAPIGSDRKPAAPGARSAPNARDTLPRPATADTVRRTRDSTTIAVPIGTDTTRRAGNDSLRGTPDSLPTPKVKRDSIKAAIVRGELPTQGIVAGPAYRFRGDSILATGALSVADLIERVPGLTVFRSGYIASAQTAAYLGDFRRVRVFRDGVELDAADPRNGGVLDLTEIQLFQAEEVSIEPTAGEVRVWIRTRAPRNTTPQTRVDIYTGDEETNLYRAFYGKRFTNGGLAQLNIQQFSTGGRSAYGGGGEGTNALIRLGWARGNRSIDVLLSRVDRRRNLTRNPFGANDSLLVNFLGRRDEAYLRAGYGDPEQGVWAQAIANVLRVRQEAPKRALGDTLPVADTSVYRNQYVLTGGFTRYGVRFTVTDRYRVGEHASYHAPSVRASYERDRLSLSAVAERVGTDSTKRLDASGRFAILPRVALVGGVSSTTGDSAVGGTRRVARAEIAAQLARTAWLSIGAVTRDGGTFLPPRIYSIGGSTIVPGQEGGTPIAVNEGRATGVIGSFRGEVLPFVTVDLGGTGWSSSGVYRPRYQGRGEVRYASNFLRRFPTGEFGLTVALNDEYRSSTLFPFATSSGSTPTPTMLDVLVPQRAAASNVIGGRVEIRIQRAVVSFRSVNIGSRLYQEVPGVYLQRRTVNLYGVRWEFSN